MRTLKIIFYAICFISLVGCSEKIAIDESIDQGSLIITMELYNNSQTRNQTSSYSLEAGILGNTEYTIHTLRVFVFASDGSLDKMEYYGDLNADHVVGLKIEAPKDSSKELYFVANEPQSEDISSSLAAATSAAELKEITFEFADAMNQGFNAAASFSTEDSILPMPMTASYSLGDATVDISIHVALTRAVARVDLYLCKDSSTASRSVTLDSSTTLSATGATWSSSLFAASLPTVTSTEEISVASSAVTLSTSSYERVLSFYTAERTYDYTDTDTNITFSVNGLLEDNTRITDSKSVTLGDETLKEINRNYIYQIYGTYSASEPEIVTAGFVIQEWVDVEVDGEIEGVMIAVDSEVAMDWLLNGNSYTSSTISFGSNKPISFYLPVSVSGSSDSVVDYEFKLFEFDDMSAGSSYELKNIDLVNHYIYATNWIESAVIHFTSSQSGYITFVYSPQHVNYKIQSYPIRIKSDNVTKQMKAVYDNGYFPASDLSDVWAQRAPGGVIFAKRGEAKHPVTTPEILYRDDDGYYRGEHQLTATQASDYCTEQLGEGWYIPSYSDMIEIATMYDKLGVSYRFQNNGSQEGSGLLTQARYWSSSESSSMVGYYWSADFMSRSYMTENLMERNEAENSYFVRCVKDLQ